jgi:hypothetical protein
MELNHIEKNPFNVYHFDELKKMKFNKFEIYLGSESHPLYYCKGEEYYSKLVPKQDYDK